MFQWEYDSSKLEEGGLITSRMAKDGAKFCGEAAFFTSSKEKLFTRSSMTEGSGAEELQFTYIHTNFFASGM